jgi:hypothetical protein
MWLRYMAGCPSDPDARLAALLVGIATAVPDAKALILLKSSEDAVG